MTKLFYSKTWLWVELFGLFVAVPLALMVEQSRWLKFAALWAATAFALGWLCSRPGFSWRGLWQGQPETAKRQRALRHRLELLALAIVPLTILAAIYAPDRLFWLPRTRPEFWLLIAVLYPLLSALPQEIAYRPFFFDRYHPILGTGTGMVISSAAAFGFVHVMFGNWIAPTLSFLGGLLFARGFDDDRSLKWATIEHALYGLLVFTVGLGHFFVMQPIF